MATPTTMTTMKDARISLQVERNRLQPFDTFKLTFRGISIQNPRQPATAEDEVQNLIKTAMSASASRTPQQPQPTLPQHFAGTGYTLGSDSHPSQPITSQIPVDRQREPVRRVLTLWRNGFSIDDGPLFPFTDPESVEILREIRMGRVPRNIAGVQPGDDVEMRLEKRDDEDYTPSQRSGGRPGGSFIGHGNRLGRYHTVM